MKEAGEILKKARESKNLSLHEIGMSLKINPKTLQAIESGDESKLPPKTFLRGFIKSYAQFLKLDVNEVLRASQDITVVQVPAETTGHNVNRKRAPRRYCSTKSSADCYAKSDGS